MRTLAYIGLHKPIYIKLHPMLSQQQTLKMTCALTVSNETDIGKDNQN